MVYVLPKNLVYYDFLIVFFRGCGLVSILTFRQQGSCRKFFSKIYTYTYIIYIYKYIFHTEITEIEFIYLVHLKAMIISTIFFNTTPKSLSKSLQPFK